MTDELTRMNTLYNRIFLFNFSCRVNKNDFLLFQSPYHHWCGFQWIMIAFPCLPVYSISIRRMFSGQVESIQIDIMTCIIPPAPFETGGTIWRMTIIIPVFCREFLSFMIGERISCKKDRTLKRTFYDTKRLNIWWYFKNNG